MAFTFRGVISHHIRNQVMGVFIMLFLATLGVMIFSLVLHKQAVKENYLSRIKERYEAIDFLFRNSAAQTSLQNLQYAGQEQVSRPYELNVSAVAVDDPRRAQDTVTQSGCSFKLGDDVSEICFGIGNQRTVGAYIYGVGFFSANGIVPHSQGSSTNDVHRMLLTIDARGTRQGWIAVFQEDPRRPNRRRSKSFHYRITAYRTTDDGSLPSRAIDDKGFMGILASPERTSDCETEICTGKWSFTFRAPLDMYRGDATSPDATWPPSDIGRAKVQLRVLGPISTGSEMIFNSDTPGAVRKFSIEDKLNGYVEPNEVLRILKHALPNDQVLWESTPAFIQERTPSAFALYLSHLLPGSMNHEKVTTHEIPGIPGQVSIELRPNAKVLDNYMAPVVQQYLYLLAMMFALITGSYLWLDGRVVRRIRRLTDHAKAVFESLKLLNDNDIPEHNFSNLGGRDELGVLAATLDDVLKRLGDEYRVRRERLIQYQTQWRAIGHELFAPLQTLEALIGKEDKARRHVNKMLLAVNKFKGVPSVREADFKRNLSLKAFDVAAFLVDMCRNTTEVEGIEYQYRGPLTGVKIQADEMHLESALDNVFQNAKRFTPRGDAVEVTLEVSEGRAKISVKNNGPWIRLDPIDRVFEYGVSDDSGDPQLFEHSGQGLYIAQQYVAAMGGSISAANVPVRGVAFTLYLPLVK